MGLLSFVKSAGKKLFGGDDSENTEALKKEIDGLGLDAKGLDIKVEGEKVVVAGDAISQEVKEKVLVAVGNVEGVAEVEDMIEGSEGTYHTVVKGDTLWAIAEKTMGNGTKYQEIFEANRPMLSDPDKIYPGQVLRIPV